ncbi:MAG: hypothetical protein IIZ93_00830, partial [Acidaminococcaceae bacterium]|nr:hypothetical protein [Acidaminococcaceae bacterium]
MSKYDEINEVKKADSIDHIEEVEKFNPFHDALGKFSSSNGFKSYSANPKTKAGAMAIQRSAAAGHGRTLNVHRESKGENIAQNDNWLRTGQKPKVPAAVSRARYQQRKLKQQQAAQQAAQQNQQNQAQQKPAPKPAQAQQKPSPKPAQQAQQKPAQTTAPKSLAADVAGVTVTTKDKLSMQARNGRGSATTTRSLAKDNYQERVAGKDITKSVDVSKISGGKDPIDKIAIAQGWDKSPTVTNDKDMFDAACMKSGRVMFRSVHADAPTRMTNDQVATETMSNGKTALGGSGGKAYGSGLYLVDSSIKSGVTPRKMNAASHESYYYGDRQMMATLHPSAKIASTSQALKIRGEFRNLSSSDQARFGRDLNSYIAS